MNNTQDQFVEIQKELNKLQMDESAKIAGDCIIHHNRMKRKWAENLRDVLSERNYILEKLNKIETNLQETPASNQYTEKAMVSLINDIKHLIEDWV